MTPVGMLKSHQLSLWRFIIQRKKQQLRLQCHAFFIGTEFQKCEDESEVLRRSWFLNTKNWLARPLENMLSSCTKLYGSAARWIFPWLRWQKPSDASSFLSAASTNRIVHATSLEALKLVGSPKIQIISSLQISNWYTKIFSKVTTYRDCVFIRQNTAKMPR